MTELEPQKSAEPPNLPPKSGFYGVWAQGGKWCAKLYFDGKRNNLGKFSTKEQAAAVYDRAVQEHRSSDALKLNFASAEEGEAAAAAAAAEWQRKNPSQQIRSKLSTSGGKSAAECSRDGNASSPIYEMKGACAPPSNGGQVSLKTGSELSFWDAIGRPTCVMSPMVDQSELAFRLLCRRYCSPASAPMLCYTPMLHSARFVRDASYRKANFQTTHNDRPLVAQLAGHDPEALVAAARLLQDHVDAVV